ncbi:MAG: nuclear transport factor 2 family protein [Burkholderiales bacterium]|nr:nuclear transport factor 2 family protein [Burkholderiales bacterium]
MTPPLFANAEQAEMAFYRAFEANDLDAMMAVWDDTDDIVCIHPMGPALNGRQAVIDSWREILSGGVAMRFSLEKVQTYTADNLSIHMLNEHIDVASGNRVAPMAATNIFRLSPQGWHMVSHHASPNPGTQTAKSNPLLH